MKLERRLQETSLPLFRDLNCKNLLSIKKITATLFKYIIPSFYECSCEDIMNMIESCQLTKDNKFLESLNIERNDGNRLIRYDLLFKSLMPNGTMAYFDLEPHSSYNESIINRRSEVYASFGIMSQLKTENISSNNYDGLKDFYTLWIIRTNHKESSIKIVEEYVTENQKESVPIRYKGSYHHKIFIHVGTMLSEDKGIRLIQMLFSLEVENKELNDMLEVEYGFRLDDEESEERTKMQELAMSYFYDGVEKGRNEEKAKQQELAMSYFNDGIEKGRSEGLEAGKIIGIESTRIEDIKSLMLHLNLTPEIAMKALGIAEEEQDKYLSLLN